MKQLVITLLYLIFIGSSIESLGQLAKKSLDDPKIIKEIIEKTLESTDEIQLGNSSTNKRTVSKGENSFGNTPNVAWAEKFGGSSNDYANAVVTDGSGNAYITGTFSGHIVANGTDYYSVGKDDAFVAKYSSNGILVWFTHIAATDDKTVYSSDIAIDSDGSIYITGYYTGLLTLGFANFPDLGGYTLFYVKINPEGSVIDGNFHCEYNNERGLYINLDNDKNIYITASTITSIDSGHSSCILKYNQSAELIWSKFFGLGLNNFKVTSNGIYYSGVVSCGNSGYLDENVSIDVPATFSRVFIAKSDFNGVFQWGYVANHSLGGYSDRGVLSVDENNNVYLVGYNSFYIGFGEHEISGDGIFLVKFNETDGFLWLQRVGTSGSAKLFVDDSGNSTVIHNTNISKYDTNGNLLQSGSLEQFANSITMHGSELLLAGSDSGLAFLSKYNESFMQSWISKFDGDSGVGQVNGIATDDNGFVYTYAYVSSTVDYFGQQVNRGTFLCKQDEEGNIIWIKLLPDINYSSNSPGNQIVIDNNNRHVCIVGRFYDNLVIPGVAELEPAIDGSTFIIKYDLDGNYINHIQEDYKSIKELSINVDNSGNLLLSDSFRGTSSIGGTALSYYGFDDTFLAKYDSNISLLWVLSVGGDNIEYSLYSSTDIDGNIYITGESLSENLHFGATNLTMTPGQGNILLAKLASTGEIIWIKSVGASGSDNADSYCWPTGIVTSPEGDFYIKGWHGSSSSFDEFDLSSPYTYNYFVARFNTDGHAQWVNSINEETFGFDYNQFDIDDMGNVYLGAQAQETIYFGDEYAYTPTSRFDFFVAKYNNNGGLEWVKCAQGDGSSNISLKSVVENNGNIYIGGKFSSFLSIDDETFKCTGTNGFFVKLQSHIYQVSFSVIGENGSLSASVDENPIASGAQVQAGKDVSFVAEPADGYQVKEWIVNGMPVDENATNSLTIYNLKTNTNVTVEFEPVGSDVNIYPLSNVEVFPNPFYSKFTLRNISGVRKVIISTLTGQIVMEVETKGLDVETIQVDELNSGIYFILFETEDGLRAVRKIVKE